MRDLPTEKPFASTPRRVAGLVLGALALVLGANEAARRTLPAHTPNIGYALVPQKWRLLLERERPIDWLVLGDSSCNQGVDPVALAGVLGGETLNLCTVASSLALDAAWMLDRHVERLGAPGAVLAVHAYHLWHRELEPFAVAHVPLGWGFWRTLPPGLEPGLAWSGRAFIARYVPLYAEHRSLARLLMRPWEAERHYEADARGFMAVPRGSAESVERDARKRLAWLTAPPERVLSAQNQAALAHLGRLAGTHDFDVYLANAPVYRGIADSPDYHRYQQRVAAALDRVAARHPRLHRLDGEYVFDGAEMQNGDHLLAAGASRYSRDLAGAIARRRALQLATRRR